jgi:hypothetical protein
VGSIDGKLQADNGTGGKDHGIPSENERRINQEQKKYGIDAVFRASGQDAP